MCPPHDPVCLKEKVSPGSGSSWHSAPTCWSAINIHRGASLHHSCFTDWHLSSICSFLLVMKLSSDPRKNVNTNYRAHKRRQFTWRQSVDIRSSQSVWMKFDESCNHAFDCTLRSFEAHFELLTQTLTPNFLSCYV